jgi:hypothetical protein
VANKSDALSTSDFLYLFDTPHNATITWDHLLRQTSDWEGTLWGKPDWADRPGDKPAEWTTRTRDKPGTAYKYNDTRANVLALAALSVWRRPLPQVLKETVMDPIGASNTWRWYGYENSWIVLDGSLVQSTSGGGHWGGGMFIHAYDMARFGYLTLREGRWRDRQILSKRWVEWARTPTPVQPTYGFMNWFLNTDRKLLPSAPASAFAHIGNGTNMIYVDPEHDLVAVVRWIDNRATDEFVKRLLAAATGDRRRAPSAARGPKRFEHGRKPFERFRESIVSVREPEDARMEHRARRFDPWAGVVADVHALAHQRMAELGEMDPNLMLAARLEAALDQRGAGKRGNRLDVRYRPFRLDRRGALGASRVSVRPAQSVAAIQDEIRLDARRGDAAVRDRVIDALDVVRAEPGGKRALRARRPRKHDEAARVAVESMDHAERGVGAVAACLAQQRSRVVGERLPVAGLVGNAQHPGGLVDHDDVAVEEHDRAVGQRTGAQLGGPFVDNHDGLRRDARRRVDAPLAVHRHASVDAKAACARPGGAQLFPNDCRDGGIGRFHVDRFVHRRPSTRSGTHDGRVGSWQRVRGQRMAIG